MLFRAHFCAALLTGSMSRTLCSKMLSEEREDLSTHVQRECSAEPFMRSIQFFHLSPILAYEFLSRLNFSTLISTPLYSSINRLYAQHPVFEIVHRESVKIYLHMYNGNVQQNPLCAASCIFISPRFSPMIFYRRANSALYRGHFLIHSRPS